MYSLPNEEFGIFAFKIFLLNVFFYVELLFSVNQWIDNSFNFFSIIDLQVVINESNHIAE